MYAINLRKFDRNVLFYGKMPVYISPDLFISNISNETFIACVALRFR